MEHIEKSRITEMTSTIGAIVTSQKVGESRTDKYYTASTIAEFRARGIDISAAKSFIFETFPTPGGGFTVRATPKTTSGAAGGSMTYTYPLPGIILDDMLPTQPYKTGGSGLWEYIFESCSTLTVILFLILLFLLGVYAIQFMFSLPEIIAEDMRERESHRKGRLRESRLYNLALSTSPELMKLIVEVVVKIPEDQWAVIKGKKILIHQATGTVQKCGVNTNGGVWDYQVILAKDLEKDPDYAKFIIAHDFAHILL
ncbi:MAG: hypothetical protein GTN76_10055 [Candidatus Aenigmarchaeota archaeon]|nr:hypothetical protein [Candidatus Aenigmarchaeota archaeon]